MSFCLKVSLENAGEMVHSHLQCNSYRFAQQKSTVVDKFDGATSGSLFSYYDSPNP